jgi:hypothetical protein
MSENVITFYPIKNKDGTYDIGTERYQDGGLYQNPKVKPEDLKRITGEGENVRIEMKDIPYKDLGEIVRKINVIIRLKNL